MTKKQKIIWWVITLITSIAAGVFTGTYLTG